MYLVTNRGLGTTTLPAIAVSYLERQESYGNASRGSQRYSLLVDWGVVDVPILLAIVPTFMWPHHCMTTHCRRVRTSVETFLRTFARCKSFSNPQPNLRIRPLHSHKQHNLETRGADVHQLRVFVEHSSNV